MTTIAKKDKNAQKKYKKLKTLLEKTNQIDISSPDKNFDLLKIWCSVDSWYRDYCDNGCQSRLHSLPISELIMWLKVFRYDEAKVLHMMHIGSQNRQDDFSQYNEFKKILSSKVVLEKCKVDPGEIVNTRKYSRLKHENIYLSPNYSFEGFTEFQCRKCSITFHNNEEIEYHKAECDPGILLQNYPEKI